ncbi:MAG: type VI secretion system protein TssA [Sedimentisphaerales bacterium]|nr:type VI secretion system protein TssA [Sedimentisphaerales bacterium]
MSDFDINSLLAEVSAESPCGEDVSYDETYLALENIVQPKPQTAVGQADVQEPKWSEVLEKASELLQRSKNLRVALYVTLALLKLKGIPGLRDGLLLVRGLLERYWDCLYPQLDPDDDNDPVERMNILMSLSPRLVSVQDPMKFRQRILEVPLCSSRRLGSFSARDVQVAKGQIKVSDEEAAEAPQISKIDAAFKDTPAEQLETTWQAIHESLEHIAAITNGFAERSANNQAPDLSMLEKLLKGIAGFVQGYIGGAPKTASSMREGVQDMDGNRGVVTGQALTTSGINEIRSREDVVFILKKACDYFAHNEPSSPVPLLLRRAQRLVSKSFVEVIEDVCPDAMTQIEIIGGTNRPSDSNHETGEARE